MPDTEKQIMGITTADGIHVDFGCESFLAADMMLDPFEPIGFSEPVDYLVVTKGAFQELENGQMIPKATLDDAKFGLKQRQFLDRIINWYGLQRVGREWKAGKKTVTADWVKQKMFAALRPFSIPEKEIDGLYKALRLQCQSTDETAPPLDIVTAEDLKQEFTKPPFIVQDILCAGLTILAAPPKTGKSFLVLDLACAIAEGRDFWGLHTEQGSVLYLDLEGTAWRTQERFPAIGRKSKTDCPAALSMAYHAAAVDAGLIDQLSGWIDAAPNPRLIVIDTLAHIKGRVARGEDAYQADTRFMKPLHDLAIAKGVAIITVTHTRKSNGFALDDPFDAVIGSTAQYGNSDGGWVISGKRTETTKVFTAEGRDYERISFNLEKSKTGRWICIGRTEELQAQSEYDRYQADPFVVFLRGYLPKCGGGWTATAQDIINTIATETGHFQETDAIRMSKIIRELAPQLLEHDGIATILPDGGGRKGRRFTFKQRDFVQ